MQVDEIELVGQTSIAACAETMLPNGATTHFAPAGRDSHQELRRLRDLLRKAALLQPMLDAMPSLVVLLNERRQILVASRAFLDLVQTNDDESLGRRPGEIVGCVHVVNGPDGCGTARNCAACGAVAAIIECQRARVQITREARLTTHRPAGEAALDFRITASPLEVEGQWFTLCMLEDISAKKQLDVMSRTFFHDVLNTAGSVRGYVNFLTDEAPAASPCAEELARLRVLADQLVEEIESHRDFLHAESGRLVVEPQRVRVPWLLNDLRTRYCRHAVGSKRRIELDARWDGTLMTDRRLLSRVLGNLVKNALEATEPGGTIRVSCIDRGPQVAFQVWNAAVMPPAVQLQVFQRSFSTKEEAGRGVGTHSVKLLAQRYLGGQVEFVSRPSEGTTFTVTLPKELPAS